MSYVEPFMSTLQRSRRKSTETLTFTLPISQTLSKQALRATESMIEDIVSSVEVLENLNVKTYNTKSYIENIESDAKKIVRATRIVKSNVQPIGVLTNIEIPFEPEKPIFASVYIMGNQSNTHTKENATEMSVI